MKNILRENMRRFGTKNLNEAPEFEPFIAMDDIVIDVMATRSSGTSTSIIKFSNEYEGNIGVHTIPGEYNVDNDIIKVIISGKDQQIFECSGAVIQGKKSKVIDYVNIDGKCEIELAVKDLMDDHMIVHDYVEPKQYALLLKIKSNARYRGNLEKDPNTEKGTFELHISLGESSFERKRTPSITVGDVESTRIK